MKVEFNVDLPRGFTNGYSRYQIAECIAEKLSISLMLKELGINDITIDGNHFDLLERRRRNNRFE